MPEIRTLPPLIYMDGCQGDCVVQDLYTPEWAKHQRVREARTAPPLYMPTGNMPVAGRPLNRGPPVARRLNIDQVGSELGEDYNNVST